MNIWKIQRGDQQHKNENTTASTNLAVLIFIIKVLLVLWFTGISSWTLIGDLRESQHNLFNEYMKYDFFESLLNFFIKFPSFWVSWQVFSSSNNLEPSFISLAFTFVACDLRDAALPRSNCAFLDHSFRNFNNSVLNSIMSVYGKANANIHFDMVYTCSKKWSK